MWLEFIVVVSACNCTDGRRVYRFRYIGSCFWYGCEHPDMPKADRNRSLGAYKTHCADDTNFRGRACLHCMHTPIHVLQLRLQCLRY